MGEVRKVFKVLVESPKERDHSEDRGLEWKMKSECILGRLSAGVFIGFSWLKIEAGLAQAV
jgi:hypothetical protein